MLIALKYYKKAIVDKRYMIFLKSNQCFQVKTKPAVHRNIPINLNLKSPVERKESWFQVTDYHSFLKRQVSNKKNIETIATNETKK